ncbi:MAG: outer membrane lipoprotein-sorting protein [Deltaproteobacteria bacterium]|nr:outer membrane lipoprotein-sorting protein [Deltaproteobacteria bacterium]
MSRLQWITIFFLLCTTPSFAGTLTGREIMLRQAEQDKGFHDEVSMGVLTIVNPRGVKTVRKFKLLVLEANNEHEKKTMIKIEAPADLKGTGLLSHQNKERAHDQWLYLPALKKTQRLTGSLRTGRFTGSDFAYEDLSPRAVDDDSHQLLQTEPCLDTRCYVVVSIPQIKDTAYSKITLWVRTDNYQVIRTDMYNKKGDLFKRAHFENFSRHKDKFLRAQRITMKNLIKGGESVLEFVDINMQTMLRDEALNRAALER